GCAPEVASDGAGESSSSEVSPASCGWANGIPARRIDNSVRLCFFERGYPGPLSWLCPKSDSRDSAVPPDVRKRSALPYRFVMNSGLRPKKLGIAQESKWRTCRKAKGLPHIRRHSRRLLGQSPLSPSLTVGL